MTGELTRRGNAGRVVALAACGAMLIAAAGCESMQTQGGHSPSAAGQRIFELRTYTAAEGKIDALHRRFRDHTDRLFHKHGMQVIAYWSPADPEKAKTTFVYLLAFPSRQARDQCWRDFSADPDWQSAKRESEKDGKLVTHVDSLFLSPTDFSPMK